MLGIAKEWVTLLQFIWRGAWIRCMMARHVAVQNP